MKHTGRRILLAAIFAAAALLLFSAAAADETDTWGSLRWRFYTSTGRLTINGNGAMNAFTADSTGGWHKSSVKNNIKTVEIGSGVTSIGAYAFYECRNLKSVSVSGGMAAIGDFALYGTGITDFTVPTGVTSIGKFAFSHSSLQSITLPADVKTVGYHAFAYCPSLKDVHAANLASFLSIEYLTLDGLDDASSRPNGGTESYYLNCRLFVGSGGTETKEVTVPDSVKTIGKYAFSNFTGLTAVMLPNTVTAIGSYAFFRCAGLTSFRVPDGVQHIEAGTFSRCGGLTEVILPDGLTEIGNFAFSDCTGLTELTLPDTVSVIGKNAFSGCTGLRSITIPPRVTSIGEDAFPETENLVIICAEGSAAHTWALDHGIAVELRDMANITASGTWGAMKWKLDDTGLLTVSGKGFIADFPSESTAAWHDPQAAGQVRKVVLDSRITGIGNNAFAHCGALEEITLPAGLCHMGEAVFRECGSLERIEIPAGVSEVSKCAFRFCTGLKTVTLPDNLSQISACAFQGCTGLEELEIPSAVSSFGTDCFQGCRGLKSITLPDITYYIGLRAFQGCTGLTSVSIPGDVETVPEQAFLGCTGLETVVIREGVNTLEKEVFYGCTGLKQVFIPDSVTSIGSNAFGGHREGLCIYCSADSEACRVAEALGIRWAAAADCPHPAKWRVPEGEGLSPTETEPGRTPQSRCGICGAVLSREIPPLGEMSWLILPRDTERVEEGAFEGGAFDAVRIPDGCLEVGSRAFAMCPNLRYIIAGQGTEIDPAAFEDCGEYLLDCRTDGEHP